MQSFFKSNMVFKSARKTRSHPGREAPMLTPTTPLLLCPQAPKVLHFTYLAIDLCPCLLTCSCALDLHPCPLTCAPALSPMPMPVHLCPGPLTGAYIFLPVPPLSHPLPCVPVLSHVSQLFTCVLSSYQIPSVAFFAHFRKSEADPSSQPEDKICKRERDS